MQSVWKVSLSPDDVVKIIMPINSTPLSVQVQRDTACMWFMVDPNEVKRETRKFIAVGTGQYFSDQIKAFIGTFQFPEDNLVFHVFEIK